MFTPPPSPDPRRTQRTGVISSAPTPKPDLAVDHSPRLLSSLNTLAAAFHSTPSSPKEDPQRYRLLQKKRIGRRIRWAVFLVPLLLVAVALSVRHITHPVAPHVLSSPTPDWSSVKDWSPHKRHAAPTSPSSATTVQESKQTGTALSVVSSPSAVPTQSDTSNAKVPWTKPALPTPFPQPFDSILSNNFSTVGCENFITNMTLSPAFRQCRPFSLLVSDSNEFITSQRNASELNVMIWGTCNTDLSAEQCSSNMAWFSQNIKTTCKEDISADNAVVRDAVNGLQAYDIMREVACQVNSNTDTYCYLEAAQSTYPSDLYLYQLPLGLPLPNNTEPSCTPCVQSLMSAYVKDGLTTTDLMDTYGSAANIVNQACGNEFVATVNISSSNGATGVAGDVGLRWSVGMAVVGSALLAGQLTL